MLAHSTLLRNQHLEWLAQAGITLAMHVAREAGLLARLRGLAQAADVATISHHQRLNPVAVREWLQLMRNTPWIIWDAKTDRYAINEPFTVDSEVERSMSALMQQWPSLRQTCGDLTAYLRGTARRLPKRGFFQCLLWLDAVLGESLLKHAA